MVTIGVSRKRNHVDIKLDNLKSDDRLDFVRYLSQASDYFKKGFSVAFDITKTTCSSLSLLSRMTAIFMFLLEKDPKKIVVLHTDSMNRVSVERYFKYFFPNKHIECILYSEPIPVIPEVVIFGDQRLLGSSLPRQVSS